MNKFVEEFLASGKQLVKDSKVPRQTITKKKAKSSAVVAPMLNDEDPHKMFVSRVINQKMKAKDIVSDIQKICDMEDAKL
jgi:hypothetical protein